MDALFLFALLGIGGAIFLALYVAFDQVEERSTIRASLRQLQGYEVESVRDRELLDP
jgi:hypothetical protein